MRLIREIKGDTLAPHALIVECFDCALIQDHAGSHTDCAREPGWTQVGCGHCGVASRPAPELRTYHLLPAAGTRTAICLGRGSGKPARNSRVGRFLHRLCFLLPANVLVAVHAGGCALGPCEW